MLEDLEQLNNLIWQGMHEQYFTIAKFSALYWDRFYINNVLSLRTAQQYIKTSFAPAIF